MSRAILPLTVLAVLAGIVGGCGDEAVFRTNRPLLRVTLDEYRIVPQHIVVKPGRLKIVVRNTGRQHHNLVVQIPGGPDDKPVDLPGGRVDTIQPGESGGPIKLDLKPGEYRLVCTIANHDDLGQYGELEVKE
jgi:uncharacterized cupredoxin-like copper-binding protein